MFIHVQYEISWKNYSWSFPSLQHIWREAIIIPIYFDKRHTWKPHKLTIMRKLAGTTWWTDEQIPKTSYQGTVRPNLENSIGNNCQRQPTELNTKHCTLSQEPWSRPWRNTKIQSHNYECLTDHNMEGKLQCYTKNRLKSNSFIHETKKPKTTKGSRHARYSRVYGWHHEPSRNWYINSDISHEGTSHRARNRWWQYQTH